jgi:low affinity Fe/Cu permease
MLTRLIVKLYTWIIEISLWLALLASAVVGYNTPVPFIRDAGPLTDNAMAWSIYMAIFMPVLVFLFLAVVTGPLLVLVDIRRSVRAIEAALRTGASAGSDTVSIEYKEPHL